MVVVTQNEILRENLSQRAAARTDRIHIASAGQMSLFLTVDVLNPENSKYTVFQNHIALIETNDFDDAVLVYGDPTVGNIAQAETNLNDPQFGN